MPWGSTPPETRYARVRDAHVAYQDVGEGPPLVLVADWFSHVDGMWTWPPFAHSLRRLASFSRLIVFDKRGVGLSDPVLSDLPAIEEWQLDVRAVLDAAGCERASVMGVGAGGPMCMAFAAAQPDRVDRMVLVNSYARLLRDDDYHPGYPPHLRDRILAMAYTDTVPARVLRGADDEQFTRWWAWYQRQSVSPGTAHTMRAMMFDVDVRWVLPAIRANTLVLHRRDDQWIRLDHAEYLRDHIPQSELVTLDGPEDLFFQGDTDSLLDEVERWVTDADEPVFDNRVLATVLFSDIVRSTELAAELGDHRWRLLLDDHDAIVGRHVDSHGGRLVKYTGDGHLAVFDGPGRAIRAATRIRSELRSIGLGVRMGIHVGEIELRGDDVGGLGVVIGARIADLAEADEILASRTVRDLVVGSGIAFVGRGSRHLKGVPGDWDLHQVAL